MLKIKANAKINLTLDVVNKREDGYHNLKMIMMEIPLCDTLILSKADNINVSTNFKFLPNNNKNTAYKAAVEFFSYTKIDSGVKILIEKHIPVCAGLAGGSADAAAVLKGLNQLFDTKLSMTELEKLGDKVGKDVPFCIRGGVCLAEGTGDKLTDLQRLPSCYIVLIKPQNINVSTKEIFTAIDASKIELHPDTTGVINALENGSLEHVCRRLYNVLEDTTTKLHPSIGNLKKEFLESGAIGTVMSGSGPSVFGIYNNEEKAKNAYQSFLKIDKSTFLLKI